MTDRSTTTPNAGIRAFVARRPVTAFLIMAFAIAYPVMLLAALAVHGVIPGGSLLEGGMREGAGKVALLASPTVMVHQPNGVPT